MVGGGAGRVDDESHFRIPVQVNDGSERSQRRRLNFRQHLRVIISNATDDAANTNAANANAPNVSFIPVIVGGGDAVRRGRVLFLLHGHRKRCRRRRRRGSRRRRRRRRRRRLELQNVDQLLDQSVVQDGVGVVDERVGVDEDAERLESRLDALDSRGGGGEAEGQPEMREEKVEFFPGNRDGASRRQLLHQFRRQFSRRRLVHVLEMDRLENRSRRRRLMMMMMMMMLVVMMLLLQFRRRRGRGGGRGGRCVFGRRGEGCRGRRVLRIRWRLRVKLKVKRRRARREVTQVHVLKGRG